jgi:hypothetical protein
MIGLAWGLTTTTGDPVMNRSLLLLALTAGCAAPAPATLLAYAGPTGAGVTRPSPVLVVAPVPEEVLRDPQQRAELLIQFRRQIVYHLRRVPEPTYQQRTRPALGRQLRAAGLAEADVAWVLRDVDYSRGL